MDGRVCLVTGASSGIGKATAVELARRGAKVAVVGRSADGVAAALQAVREVGRSAYAFRADFSSLDEVRRLAREVRETLPRLDVLINNAGLWHQRRTMSEDGFEDTFAVNHLAHFLLTQLLVPWMLQDLDEERRIVHVSSRLHEIAGLGHGVVGKARRTADVLGLKLIRPKARLDLSDVQCAQGFDGLAAYARSKLAQILFSNELARRLADKGITSNALHPGNVNTNVTRDSRLLSWGIRLISPAILSPADGAATSIHVASSPELRGVTGKYFDDCREVPPAEIALDQDAAREVWDLSMAMVGLSPDVPRTGVESNDVRDDRPR